MDIAIIIKAAGGVTSLAKKLGISHSSVIEWKRVPPRHAMKISEITGIALHELRNDIFPAPK